MQNNISYRAVVREQGVVSGVNYQENPFGAESCIMCVNINLSRTSFQSSLEQTMTERTTISRARSYANL